MPPVTGDEPIAGHLLAGRYRLDSLIASGGVGDVWRAIDHLLARPVAIKLINEADVADEVFLSRFRAWARFAASLSHPGVAQVLDYGESDDTSPRRPYLVTELVAGRQLSALIAKAGALPTGVVLDITAQAARALQAAHDLGMTHRDVSPANILITDDGRVKITGFGIAAAAAHTALVTGTATCMSPEQAGGKTLTPASDIYSLGVVAYQCIAGRLPFTADSPQGPEVAQGPPQPLPTGIAAPVRELIHRMIATEPERRASAQDIAEAADLVRVDAGSANAPRLADVAAWVAAGIGDPDPEADGASASATATEPQARAPRGRRRAGPSPATTTESQAHEPPPRRDRRAGSSGVTVSGSQARRSESRRQRRARLSGATATGPRAHRSAHRRWSRVVLAGALICAAAGGVSAVLATGILPGKPGPATGPARAHRPAAQVPTPTVHVIPGQTKVATTQAPLTTQVSASALARPAKSARSSSRRARRATARPSHSASPVPSRSPAPSHSPTSTPAPSATP